MDRKDNKTSKTVALTGAAGRLGNVLRVGFQERFEALRLIDRRPMYDSRQGEELIIADVTDDATLQKAFEGCDVVIHLAAVPNDDARFPDLVSANIEGVYRVLDAARQCGVRRVVLASTHHVIGYYPQGKMLDIADAVRPDSVYAASKCFAEALGRLFFDKWNLEVICVRIGSLQKEPQDRRQVSTWLSHRDAVHLFERTVLAENVGFEIVYGVSANSSSWWRDDAAEKIGYHARDDGADFEDRFRNVLEDNGGNDRQGGAFATSEYWIEG